MANLLIKKVMDNMARQHRKDNGTSRSVSTVDGAMGNISKVEENLLLNIIKSKEEGSFSKSSAGQKVSLSDLAGYREKDCGRKGNTPSKISLEELAKKHGKRN